MPGHNSIRYNVTHLQTKKISTNNHRRWCCHTHIKLFPTLSWDRNNCKSPFNLLTGNEDPQRGKRGQKSPWIEIQSTCTSSTCLKGQCSFSFKLVDCQNVIYFFLQWNLRWQKAAANNAWKDNCFVGVDYGGRCPSNPAIWVANADKCSSTAWVSPQANKLNDESLMPVYGRCMIKTYIGCRERHNGSR